MGSRSLDGKQIRIKGTDVTTKVRFCCYADNLGACVVTEMSCINFGDWKYPQARQFVTGDNPYGDLFPIDQIEVVGHEKAKLKVTR